MKTAFFHGDLYSDVELYVKQPTGCIIPGLVLRLLKPLYGLKQAHREWNEKFNSFLVLFGLIQVTINSCISLLVHPNDPVTSTLLGLFVDDGAILSKYRTRALAIVPHLKEHFQML